MTSFVTGPILPRADAADERTPESSSPNAFIKAGITSSVTGPILPRADAADERTSKSPLSKSVIYFLISSAWASPAEEDFGVNNGVCSFNPAATLLLLLVDIGLRVLPDVVLRQIFGTWLLSNKNIALIRNAIIFSLFTLIVNPL